LLTSDFFVTNRKSRTEVSRYQHHAAPVINENPNNENYLYIAPSWKDLQSTTIEFIEEEYPMITHLLIDLNSKILDGLKLVAAGGAIFKALYRDVADDVDFFFVDENQERLSNANTNPEVAKLYDMFLITIITYLTNAWFNERVILDILLLGNIVDRKTRTRKNPKVYVARGEFVTTVHLTDYHDSESLKYQFIHRVYPSVESILGGFDLGPAMVAYDGHRILATELGAWSALSKTIIVDISRRSTSFEHRLKKYSNTCHVLYPGLAPDTTSEHLSSWITGKQCHQELMEIIEEHDYQIKPKTYSPYRYNQSFNDHYHNRYNNSNNEDEEIRNPESILIKRTPETSKEDLMSMICELAADRGYDLHNFDEDNLISHDNPNNIDLSVQELVKVLKDRAYENGFTIDMDEFYRYLRETRGNGVSENHRSYFRRTDKVYHYLRHRTKILTLPRMKIELEFHHANHYQELPIKMRLGKGQTRSIKNGYVKSEFSRSDYNHNNVWPVFLGEQNATCLITNNETGLVSITCFISNKTTVMNMDELGDAIINGNFDHADKVEYFLRNIIVNIDDNNVLCGDSSRDDYKIANSEYFFKCDEIIRETLMNSLHIVNLGEVEEAFLARVEDNKQDRYFYRDNGNTIARMRSHFGEHAEVIARNVNSWQ